jgi:hypothetical protein
MKNTGKRSETLADDMLHGADEIAAFLGISTAQVYHATRLRRLPIGKYGWKLIASKRALRRAHEKLVNTYMTQIP